MFQLLISSTITAYFMTRDAIVVDFDRYWITCIYRHLLKTTIQSPSGSRFSSYIYLCFQNRIWPPNRNVHKLRNSCWVIIRNDCWLDRLCVLFLHHSVYDWYWNNIVWPECWHKKGRLYNYKKFKWSQGNTIQMNNYIIFQDIISHYLIFFK